LIPTAPPGGEIPHEARWQPATELAARSLGAHGLDQSLLQDVELGLAHGRLESEKEPVVEGAWIVDAFGIGDECAGDRTDVEQMVPIVVAA
jgi:hypothetical protein